ncbi:MAG TPA: hypothetical protein VKZ59_14100 [Acidobacteriota bacterium]|nr:hypothetical protein [Acidobacteriota bacterium]
MRNVEENLLIAWRALQIGLGLAAFLAGLDKFFTLLTDWTMYLSPVAESFLPVSGATFMQLVGLIEMVVGVAILTAWTRLGAYVASVWLILIAVNLLLAGTFFDIAVRDVEMALAAFTLARLTEWREVVLAKEKGGIVKEDTLHRDSRKLMET